MSGVIGGQLVSNQAREVRLVGAEGGRGLGVCHQQGRVLETLDMPDPGRDIGLGRGFLDAEGRAATAAALVARARALQRAYAAVGAAVAVRAAQRSTDVRDPDVHFHKATSFIALTHVLNRMVPAQHPRPAISLSHSLRDYHRTLVVPLTIRILQDLPTGPTYWTQPLQNAACTATLTTILPTFLFYYLPSFEFNFVCFLFLF